MIPQEDFAPILKELERRPLQVNKYRKACGEGRSQAFGLVNRRSLPPDYSRWCWLRPFLYKLLLEFAAKHVHIDWDAITLNDNYKCDKHRDKGNLGVSFLVAFGSYTGGELFIQEGEHTGKHDINRNPFITDFSKVYHSVEPFEGKRYSLVYYKLDPKSRVINVPKPSVVYHEGKYVFKRGEEVIVNGLHHPLKKKKVVSFVIEDKPTTIDFT